MFILSIFVNSFSHCINFQIIYFTVSKYFMKNILLLVLLTILFCEAAAFGQSNRLIDLSNRLSSLSENLAERAYSNYAARANNNRTELDNMMIAQQFSATANTFRRMVQDRRRDVELRDGATLLLDIARRFPNSADSNFYWRDARRLVDDLARETQFGRVDSNDQPVEENKDIAGQVRWRGMVDDEVQLYISNSIVDARTISGTALPNGNYNFTSPLPKNRRLTVGFNKIKGRGNIKILQQPTRDNDFTAVIQIKDEGSGAKEYELEIYWTR